MAFAAERWTGAVSAGSRSRDTGRMPVNDIEGARAALHAGRVADLLGLAECGWLDVKAGVYQLDDPAKSLELAKDVSAFANAKSGGVILVGYATRKEHGEEFLAEVRPVPCALVDLDRYRKVIRELVIPVPREFTVDFIRVDDGSGILVIDVPVQPVALVPFVVPGPAGAAGSSRVSVAVPFREADATVWLPQTEIQRLLAAGWAAAGGPSQEYLNNLVEHANRTAGELARIEADREQDRMRPVLEGPRYTVAWPQRRPRSPPGDPGEDALAAGPDPAECTGGCLVQFLCPHAADQNGFPHPVPGGWQDVRAFPPGPASILSGARGR